MKFYRLLYFFLFVLTTLSYGQVIQRDYVSHSEKEGVVTIEATDGSYRICAYGDKIVETTFLPKGESWNPESHAVILKPSVQQIEIKEDQRFVEFKAGEITVVAFKSPLQLTYYYKGNILISERNGYNKQGTNEVLDFMLDETEKLYGGGARALGMDRRGNRLQLYNRAHYGYEEKAELMNFTIPLVISSKKYAVHFDNPSIGYLDLDSNRDNSLQYETINGRKTYQVIVGDSWKDLIGQYTDLTGKQPLPPRWAFGNFASRFGYHSEKETRNVLSVFKKEKIPVDAVVLDLYWFGKEMKGTMGNLEFETDSFPDYKKMISDFSKDGIQTILITEPFILTSSKKWDEAVEKKVLATDSLSNPFRFDFYFGNTGIVDIFKPEGKDWFWDIYKKYIQDGVGGWWGDLGEPEVHPAELLHNGIPANNVHNIYGHNWAKLVYEGYQRDFPMQRPFILMRAGYSGSQRFGLIPWSGDVNRTWGGLSSQPEIALQMGMQGLGYMHSDLGGFAGANLDDELYTRWLQYGVFQPIFRPHAQEEVPSEPVFREPQTKELAKQAIELRYHLLPYNYTLAYDNNQKGLPFMRPLFFEESDNEELLTYTKAYMWGDSFLVSPILKSGVTEQDVYLPDDFNWFNFYTHEVVEGGHEYSFEVDINTIPLFVKGGSFIPVTNSIQNTQEYQTKNIEVHYYYDKTQNKTQGKLYNDDGITPDAVANGMYEIVNFRGFTETGYIDLEIDTQVGENYQASDRMLKLVIYGIPDRPKNMKINGKRTPRNWDKKLKTLTIDLPLTAKTTEKVKIYLQ